MLLNRAWRSWSAAAWFRVTCLTVLWALCGAAVLWALCGAAVAQSRPTRPSLAPADNAAAALGHYSSRAAGQPRWKVVESTNFRVWHMGAPVAERVAAVAERERSVLWQVWTGIEEVPTWGQHCDVYLYPTHHDMIVMTDGKPKGGSAIVNPSRLYRGRILSRRVNLTADDRGLLNATVPHEVSHLVFGDIFAGKVPLWANEGAATMAESEGKQRYYRRILDRFLVQRQLYTTRMLVGMNGYPDFPYQSLFYAQSSSLVTFFLSLADGPTFVRFIERVGQLGYDRALQRVYGLNNLEEIHRMWLRFVAK